MDEQKFEEFLKKNFKFSRGQGIGDDASVVKKTNVYELITKDILIENIHFRKTYMLLSEIAKKAVSVNISDLCAMGGIARYFYLGLAFPPGHSFNDLKEFFRGVKESCRIWNIELAGGDFSRSKELFISITMIGEAEKPILRSTARDNDLICISGICGESSIGLFLLESGIDHKVFTDKYKNVKPEIEKGVILAKYVNSMIDVSDGLLIDLKRILKSSGKGGELYREKIPVSDEMKKICQANKLDLYQKVFAGGEDYKLLFTLSEEKELLLKKENIEYYIIGRINNNKDELKVLIHNSPMPVDAYGYDHFLPG